MADDSDFDFGTPLSGFVDRRKTQPIQVTPVDGPNNFSAYIYQCWLNVDWDGAHNAYGLSRPDEGNRLFPQQKNITPLESGSRGTLMHARRGSVGDWVGLVAMNKDDALKILQAHYPGWSGLADKRQPKVLSGAQLDVLDQFLDTRTNTKEFGSLEDKPGNGKFPIVQLKQMKQPYPGYYVSQSPAYDRSKKGINFWDQNIYLDAAKVPYSVVPKLVGVSKGDFGLVIRNKTGKSTPFLFGDTGKLTGSTTLGECSGFIYDQIAESRYNDETFSFIVFPGSGSGVADSDTVKQMEKAVRTEIGKLAAADDSLSKQLAQNDVEFRNIAAALRKYGGPNPTPPKPTEPTK